MCQMSYNPDYWRGHVAHESESDLNLMVIGTHNNNDKRESMSFHFQMCTFGTCFSDNIKTVDDE